MTNIFNTMASAQKNYPRATVRKIVKGHSRKNIGKGVDSLIYLNYVLFIEKYDACASRARKSLTQGCTDSWTMRLVKHAVMERRLSLRRISEKSQW